MDALKKKGPMRFGELAQAAEIPNHDTLSKYIKSLEDRNLVDEEPIPGVRPRANLYSLADESGESESTRAAQDNGGITRAALRKGQRINRERMADDEERRPAKIEFEPPPPERRRPRELKEHAFKEYLDDFEDAIEAISGVYHDDSYLTKNYVAKIAMNLGAVEALAKRSDHDTRVSSAIKNLKSAIERYQNPPMLVGMLTRKAAINEIVKYGSIALSAAKVEMSSD